MPQFTLITVTVLIGVIGYYRHNEAPHRWRGLHPGVSHIDLFGLVMTYSLLGAVGSWPMQTYLLGAGFLFFTSMQYHWCMQNQLWRKLDHFGIWLFISVSPLPFVARPDLIIWPIGAVIAIGYVVKFYFNLQRSTSNWCFMGLAVTLLCTFAVDPLLGEPLKWRETTWLFVLGLLCFLMQFWVFHKEIPWRYYREIQHVLILVGFYFHASAGLMLQ
jgi:predicted membrane channel-forming protein YqfA (hemolysin III family)